MTDEETWLLDTSVVVDLSQETVVAALAPTTAICVVTLAELTAGPLSADDPEEQVRRQRLLQIVEARWDPIPVDLRAARAYGELHAAVRRIGGQPRRRPFDLLIAAVARSQSLPLATRNPADLVGLEDLVDVRPV